MPSWCGRKMNGGKSFRPSPTCTIPTSARYWVRRLLSVCQETCCAVFCLGERGWVWTAGCSCLLLICQNSSTSPVGPEDNKAPLDLHFFTPPVNRPGRSHPCLALLGRSLRMLEFCLVCMVCWGKEEERTRDLE